MKKVLIGLFVLVALLSIPMAVSADTANQLVSASLPATVSITWANTCPTWTLLFESNPNTYPLSANTGCLSLDVMTNMRWDFGINGTSSGKLSTGGGLPIYMNNALGFAWHACSVTAGDDGSGGITGSATPYCFTDHAAHPSTDPAINVVLTQNLEDTDKAGSYSITLTATVVATP